MSVAFHNFRSGAVSLSREVYAWVWVVVVVCRYLCVLRAYVCLYTLYMVLD